MPERARNLVTAAALCIMAIALAILVLSSPGDVDRVEAIGERIKCPVCQGESIANSPSTMARDMMDLVAEKVASGQSDQTIIDDLLASYSGAVLLDPPARGSTLLLWLVPAAAVLAGVGMIIWWRRHPRLETPASGPTGTARRLLPLLVLAVAFAGVVVATTLFLQEPEGAASGVAALGADNLDDVSNETMEAVIAENVDHPEVDGMRLTLAERYYQEGDYRSAFPHYLAVAESPNAGDEQAVAALIRLGWMAWDGNREVDAAVGLLDQALAIDDRSSTARYLKGQVLWCGAGDTEAAARLFEEVLTDPELGEDDRAMVEADLQDAGSGASCA